jgi:hypothetical protein
LQSPAGVSVSVFAINWHLLALDSLLKEDEHAKMWRAEEGLLRRDDIGRQLARSWTQAHGTVEQNSYMVRSRQRITDPKVPRSIAWFKSIPCDRSENIGAYM